MEEKLTYIDWYLKKFEEFEAGLNGHRELHVNKIRREAIDVFRKEGFPTPRQEEWKYTNLKSLSGQQFPLAKFPGEVSREDIAPFFFRTDSKRVLVFVNGYFSRELSRVESDSKILVLDNLKNAFLTHQNLVKKYFATGADYRKNSVAALNTAFALEGAFIYVPAGVQISEPIYLLHISHPGDSSFQAHPRSLFVIDENSTVQIVEAHYHLSDFPYFNNRVSEIHISAGARLNHITIQDESQQAFCLSTGVVRQEANSEYRNIRLDIGGALVRNDLNVHLKGEGGETHLYGLYLGNGHQHIDNHTLVDHQRSNCVSNELYKGILTDKARGVFSGAIIVQQDAQKTNAFQSNKNLLLSSEAEVDSRPQLKIFADDVRCTHGATIGQLDEEALFYLRQRGISEEDANVMLRYAFATDILAEIKPEFIRKKVEERVNRRFRELT